MSDDFDLIFTENGIAVLAGVTVGDQSSSKCRVFMVESYDYCQSWINFQWLSDPILMWTPDCSVVSLSAGGFFVDYQGEDQRHYGIFSTKYQQWAEPMPLTPDRRSNSTPAIDYRNFCFVETSNNNLFFVATESDFLNDTAWWTNFFGIYGIISTLLSAQFPVILDTPIFASLRHYVNQSSSLTWWGWDDDPANYTLYRNNTVVATD